MKVSCWWVVSCRVSFLWRVGPSTATSGTGPNQPPPVPVLLGPCRRFELLPVKVLVRSLRQRLMLAEVSLWFRWFVRRWPAGPVLGSPVREGPDPADQPGRFGVGSVVPVTEHLDRWLRVASCSFQRIVGSVRPEENIRTH